MKRILLFLFICVSSSTFSQSIWTKGNAVWHYYFYNVGETGYTKLWEAGDTTVLGITCTIIKGVRHSFISGSDGSSFESISSLPTGAIYTSNDTVFYWDHDAGQFFVLYDFSAQVNDQWVLQTKEPYFGCNDTSSCVVESVGPVSLNGQNAIELTVSATSDSPSELIGSINSRFGATGCYLFPFSRRCDDPGLLDLDQVSILCFQDDSLYYNPSGGACEYYLGLDQLQDENVKVYPNPTSGNLNVLSDVPVSNIEIFDSYGRLCLSKPSGLTLTEFDLSGLNSGMYLMKITTTADQVTIKRIRRN
ncbi:T9SS type A sorting domain-containing protein [Fluviicola sp.]|uniref:T9SS type A sorting domain-containing protein n=1 Tax=Fluviicola sp. TaxID=1917219 RepID=UPI00262AD527|nr:T9SS type A sorting domain-containing protein [Fluviicola sp.]